MVGTVRVTGVGGALGPGELPNTGGVGGGAVPLVLVALGAAGCGDCYRPAPVGKRQTKAKPIGPKLRFSPVCQVPILADRTLMMAAER